MRVRLALVAVALAAVSCGTKTPPAVTSTVTVTAPPSVTSSAGPTMIVPPPPLTPTPQMTPQTGAYSTDGVYSVGTTPSGGLSAAIPPGRYRAEVKATGPFADIGGSWIRCNSYSCSSTNTDSMIDMGSVLKGQLPPVIEIAPTDVAVLISGLVLTPVS